MLNGISANTAWQHLKPYSIQMRDGTPFLCVPPGMHPKLGNLPYLGLSLSGDDRGQFVMTNLSDRLAFLRGGDDRTVEVRPFYRNVYNSEGTRLETCKWNQIEPGTVLTCGAVKFGVDFDPRENWGDSSRHVDIGLKWNDKKLPFSLNIGSRAILGSASECCEKNDQAVVLSGEEILPNHASLEFSLDGTLQIKSLTKGAAILLDGSAINDIPVPVDLARGASLLFGKEAMRIYSIDRHSFTENVLNGSLESEVWLEVGRGSRSNMFRFSLPGEDDQQSIIIGRKLKENESNPGVYETSDDTVSRVHGWFFVRGGKLWYEDLASLNGAQMNGREVIRSQLSPGDTLRLGESIIVKVQSQPNANLRFPSGESHELRRVTSTSAAIAIHGFLAALRSEERKNYGTYTGLHPFKKGEQ
ncbi:MAG: FHA domain-containing protein [Pseudomonadota bacterium]